MYVYYIVVVVVGMKILSLIITEPNRRHCFQIKRIIFFCAQQQKKKTSILKVYTLYIHNNQSIPFNRKSHPCTYIKILNSFIYRVS